MSQQGPIIVVSADSRPSFANALDDAKLFPVLDTNWADAAKAVAQLSPAAVLVACSEAMGDELQGRARRVAAKKPYLPLIAIDPATSLPDNAIPYAQAGRKSDRLIARLRSALRVKRCMRPSCAGSTPIPPPARHSRMQIRPLMPRCS